MTGKHDMMNPALWAFIGGIVFFFSSHAVDVRVKITCAAVALCATLHSSSPCWSLPFPFPVFFFFLHLGYLPAAAIALYTSLSPRPRHPYRTSSAWLHLQGEQSEHMKVSKCFNCLKYTIFSYVSCRSTLTEDNSLDGEVLYFVLVISSPPVDVFGQSVGKKLSHCPPHTVFVGQTSRQVEVRDLHINSLVYTPRGIPPPQKTIYNNCYK